MIVTSGNSSLKKIDSGSSFNNMLLRTDGFKHVLRGLAHKHANTSSQGRHGGTYTSIGKRTPAKEYHLTKDCESRLTTEVGKVSQVRRTQTAEVKQRCKVVENRDKLFEKAEE